MLQALQSPGFCFSSAPQPVLFPFCCRHPWPAAAAHLSFSELQSPPLTHQQFTCLQVSSGAQKSLPAEITLLFGSRGSAATLSDHLDDISIAFSELHSCLTEAKYPFQSFTQMLGMGVPIRALQDGTQQISCSTLKWVICYDSSLPAKVLQ